jgi:hypothetical protein
MGEILDMERHKARKLDCQGESVRLPDDLERKISAGGALARLVRELVNDFGKPYAAELLAIELYELRYGRK